MGGVTVALEQDDVFHSGTFACDRLSMVSGTFAGDRLGMVSGRSPAMGLPFRHLEYACDRLSMVSGTFAGDRLGIVNPVERSGQAEKNGNCPVQAGHVGGRQVADGFAEPAPG